MSKEDRKMELDEDLEQLITKKKISRRRFIRQATALGLSVGGGALLAPYAPAVTKVIAAPPLKKSRIVVGLGGEPASLDRNAVENALGFNLYGAIYNFLVKAGPNGEIQPSLATEWRQINDLTMEFKLRKGVKFHNGEEFDAQAVHDTITTGVLADPPGSIKTRLLPVDRVG